MSGTIPFYIPLRAMILTLHIKKLEPGTYRAEVTGTQFGTAQFEIGGIAEAIQKCASVPLEGASAFHIWYEHVCIGTTPIMNMQYDALALARRLEQLHGQVR